MLSSAWPAELRPEKLNDLLLRLKYMAAAAPNNPPTTNPFIFNGYPSISRITTALFCLPGPQNMLLKIR